MTARSAATSVGCEAEAGTSNGVRDSRSRIRRAQRTVEGACGQARRHERKGLVGPARQRSPVREAGVGVGGVLEHGVRQRSRGDVPTGRVERQGRDEQRGDAARLVGLRRGVDHTGPDGGRPRRHGPGDAPGPGAALLDRPVREQLERQLPLRRLDRPALVDVRDPTGRAVQGAVLDQDLDESRQRQQERVADVAQQPADLVGGHLVAQLQDDRAVVPRRRPTLRGEGQAQRGQGAVPAADLVVERGVALRGQQRGRVTDRVAHAAGRRQQRDLVGHRADRGEADPEPTDHGRAVTTFRRRPHRRQRRDAGRVERVPGVRGDQDERAVGGTIES